jgi:hypothetical protein
MLKSVFSLTFRNNKLKVKFCLKEVKEVIDSFCAFFVGSLIVKLLGVAEQRYELPSCPHPNPLPKGEGTRF